MAEPQDPRRPPSAPPGAPLPRLWKVEPERAPDDEEPKAKKKGKDAGDSKGKSARKAQAEKRGSSKAKADGERGKLIEETPTLDTYQARQTARIITGSVLVGVFCLSLFLVWRAFIRPARTEPDPAKNEAQAIPGPTGTPEDLEREAHNLLERAQDVAKTGNTKLAVSLLEKVNTSYPRTKAASEARAALERPRQGLPLFLDRPAVVAAGAEAAPAAAPPTPPVRVVQASPPAAPAPSAGEARLVPPVNPAEPALAARTVAPSAPATTPARALPNGFRMRPGSLVHPSGWPLEIVGDRDGAPMVLVPGATFVMGRDDGEPSEGPAHKATVGTFYIDQHEVTNRQFDLFVKETGPRRERDRALAKEREKDKDEREAHGAGSDDAPAVMVSARDAKDYADWAGKRLPTEAQWELAARSTDGRLFPWGNDPPPGETARPARQVAPIRSFPSDVSPYGVLDLAGNAWEWTKDWYDPRYYHQFAHATADNPVGPPRPKSEQLTVRGGAKNWVITRREGLKWSTRLPYLGFRCVLPVEGPGNVFEPAPAPAPGAQPAPVHPAANQGVIPF